MQRQARLDIPSALHHIMMWGINKANIFSQIETTPLEVLSAGGGAQTDVVRFDQPGHQHLKSASLPLFLTGRNPEV